MYKALVDDKEDFSGFDTDVWLVYKFYIILTNYMSLNLIQCIVY